MEISPAATMNVLPKPCHYSPCPKWSMIKTSSKKKLPPATFLSTNPSHVNLRQLLDLFTSSNVSCHRFPKVLDDGRVEPVDINKLSVALSHSLVVVSVFCRAEDIEDESLLRRIMVPPVTHFNGQLVGFGRAVSDCGLAASIHDVMVAPSIRGRGIGRNIVQKILRILSSREIYDVAAVCSESERSFFEACGFGDDMLGATTMMYTRTISDSPNANQMITQAGRRLLLVPPCRGPIKLSHQSSC